MQFSQPIGVMEKKCCLISVTFLVLAGFAFRFADKQKAQAAKS
jgi:hypothetical protein